MTPELTRLIKELHWGGAEGEPEVVIVLVDPLQHQTRVDEALSFPDFPIGLGKTSPTFRDKPSQDRWKAEQERLRQQPFGKRESVKPKYTVSSGDPIDLLVEEASEIAIEANRVVQKAMKHRRFGSTEANVHLSTGLTSKQGLEQEIGDFLEVLHRAMDSGVIDRVEVAKGQDRKRARLRELFGE